MESRLRFFKIFLVVTIFLNALLSILNYYLVAKYIPGLKTDPGILLLLSSLIFFLIAAIIVLVLSKRYPYQHISNRMEGFVFTFGIITFLLSLADLLPVYAFIDIAIDLQKRDEDRMSSALLFVSLSSLIPIICAVFTAVNSFRLLKIIRKNSFYLAQQLKNIGTDNE